MSNSTVEVTLRQEKETQRLVLSRNKAEQLKLYNQGVESITFDVEDMKLAIQAFFRLAGIYSPIDSSDWKTRLNLFIFQEKYFLSSEKDLLDFQVPPEQFQEFFALCAKETDILSGKISFTSYLKDFLEYKSRENSPPDTPKETPLVSIECPCAPVDPVIPNLPGLQRDIPISPGLAEVPELVDFSDESSPQQTKPQTKFSLPEVCRLKPDAPFTEAVFTYLEKNGGVSVVKTSISETTAYVTNFPAEDCKAYKNFIVYLESDGGVFVRKFEGETLGDPVLLTAGTDCSEVEVTPDGKHLMLFDSHFACHVAAVDLEKGEVLDSTSLSSASEEYSLDPNGNCYTIDDGELAGPDGEKIPVKYLVRAGVKNSRRIISPLSEYVVAALTHSKVVISEEGGCYVVYDNELNEVSRFRAPVANDSYLWSGSQGDYCVILLRGNKPNKFQFVVYNSDANTWSGLLKRNELKLLKKGQFEANVRLTQLKDGRPVIVSCSSSKERKLMITLLPTEDSPKLKVLFKKKLAKINGRNELPVDISIF